MLPPFPWIDVVIILALVALNGVFAMSELAIVSARKARLEAMARSGRSGAKVAVRLAADPGRFLSTVQTGITLIGVLAGAFSGATRTVASTTARAGMRNSAPSRSATMRRWMNSMAPMSTPRVGWPTSSRAGFSSISRATSWPRWCARSSRTPSTCWAPRAPGR